MESKINILLKDIKLSLKKIESNKKVSENFNIFTTLGVEILETKHSRFLAELLNPKGTHGCEDLFLKQFLLLEPINKKIENIENFCKSAKVETEQFHIVEKNQSYIDIVIESKDTAIVIENKIYARDQDKQLYRYYKAKKSEKFQNIILIYLTIDGKKPDKESLNNHLKIDDIELLSYEIHINDWLSRTIEGVESENVKMILNQYATIVKKLTNINSKEENIMIAEELMKDDNLRVAIKIADALPRAKARFEMNFYEKLKVKLSENLINFNIYSSDNFYCKFDEKQIDRIISLRTPNIKKNNDGFNGLYFYKVLKNEKSLFLAIGEDNNYLLYCKCFLSIENDIQKIQKIRKTDFKDTQWSVADNSTIIIAGEDFPAVFFGKTDEIYLKTSEEIDEIIERINGVLINEIQSDDFKKLENIMENY